MATIKSYTDLSQSKKLVEILPIESADMYYPNRTDVKYQGALPIEFKYGNPLLSQEIAAWSLAALLGVLPDYTLQTNTDGTVFVVCESKKPMISDAYDNPVDACVAMIEKLHELKML
jgi:hypothetical protein